MAKKLVNGEESLALAAQAENIDIATGYPGSPGGGIINLLMAMNPDNDHVHWSANEKIAIEKGIGVAVNKKKALVCVKSVGLNAMLDPLTVVNITPLTGALVIVVGDDPGAYGSQNDQDSRNLAPFLQMPWLEPANVQNGYDLLRLAFKISHSYAMPVFIRITRSYAMQKDHRIEHNLAPEIQAYKFSKVVSPRFVPVPGNAVEKQHELRLRINAYEKNSDSFGLHQQHGQNKSAGLIVCGHLIEKLTQVSNIDELKKHFSLLFLYSIYPLPSGVIQGFLSALQSVVVLEENTPMIANQLKVIAATAQIKLKWDVFTHPGEIFRWQISRRLKQSFPELVVNEEFIEDKSEKPILKSNCVDSQYDKVIELLDTCAKTLQIKLNYYGDPGCLVSVSEKLQAKFAMGGSVPTVFGANLANSPQELNIAFIGDSGFYHSALPAIIDAAYCQANIAMVLLNNNAAVTTGGQPHPGTKQASGGINYQRLLAACGIDQYEKFDLNQAKTKSIKIISRYLLLKGPRLLQIDINLNLK